MKTLVLYTLSGLLFLFGAVALFGITIAGAYIPENGPTRFSNDFYVTLFGAGIGKYFLGLLLYIQAFSMMLPMISLVLPRFRHWFPNALIFIVVATILIDVDQIEMTTGEWKFYAIKYMFFLCVPILLFYSWRSVNMRTEEL